MRTYTIIKIGVFKSVTDHGFPAKTYVYYGPEKHTIAIKRYYYGNDEDGGWELVKKFKDKGLYKDMMHFHLSSFIQIHNILSKFMSWNTKIHQIKSKQK